MLTALSETFIDNLDFCRTNWLIQENMRKYMEVPQKPIGKASSRHYFKNKSVSIKQYCFGIIFKILPTILPSVSYTLCRIQVIKLDR